MDKRKYCLDFPKDKEKVGTVFRASGWDLTGLGPFGMGPKLGIAINGIPTVSLSRSHRKDLKAAFPYEPRAIVGGFLGELALCSTDGNKIHFQLIEKSKEKWVPFHTIELDRAASSEGPTPRSKTYCLDELLSWPGRGDQDHEISYSENDGRRYHVSFMGMEAYKIRGVTHFHLCDDLPFLRINEENSTHPYGHRAKEILRNTDGVILDIGSGIQNVDDLLPNVVYLDAVHFENIDVVSTCPLLPFRDCCFDAIVSQAVFEHIANPWLMAKEALRVLRHGGVFYLTTAFIQPLHGDPFHYYNMTLNGLMGILDGFEVVEYGVEPFQYPSYGIQMGIESVLGYLDGPVKKRFLGALEYVTKARNEIDDALGIVGREVIAAGVFAVARKAIRK